MAIFGNLEDLPFPELLTLVGTRTGKLFIYDFIGGRSYEWHLHRATISGLLVNKQALDDVMQVRGCMLSLIEDSTSNFEFYRHDYDELLHYFSLPTEQLVLSTAAAMDELKAYRRHFPNEKTQFKSSGQMDVWLDDQLSAFWEQSRAFLERGCSAELLAQVLRLNLEQVQLNLYKLRAVGKIAPLRLYEYQTAREPERRHSDSLEAPRLEPQRLEPPRIEAPPMHAPTPTAAPDQFRAFDAAPPAKPKSLVRRMLDALSFGNPGRR